MFVVKEDEDLRILPSGLHQSAWWASFIVSYDIIYIRRCRLRSRFFCRALHPYHQDCLGYSGRDVYPSAINWSIELIIIGSCCRSKPTGEQCLNNTRSREAHVATDGGTWPLNYDPRDWHTPGAMDHRRATWSVPGQEGDDVSQLFSCAQRHGKH
jgi:hypothetical protein